MIIPKSLQSILIGVKRRKCRFAFTDRRIVLWQNGGCYMIKNNKGEIIGTWTLFDEMNDVTLAYNLGSLNKEELELVPYSYIAKWEEWKQKQIKNKYWNNSLHC